jgi:hypothetical protein
MAKALLGIWFIATFASPLAAWACEGHPRLEFDKPTALTGVLQSGKGNHDAQGPFNYVYIALDAPVCIDAPQPAPGDDDAVQSVAAPVTRIQLAGEAVGTTLPMGKPVSVEGTLFAAHTMWHVEDVLIDAADVKPR